jgi:superfamily I DNA/RNA helicase
MKKPAVTLSTIHSAKGSEWDHVLVIGLKNGDCCSSQHTSARAAVLIPRACSSCIVETDL